MFLGVHVHMYVRVWPCLYLYAYVSIPIYTHVWLHKCIHAQPCVPVPSYLYACSCVYSNRLCAWSIPVRKCVSFHKNVHLCVSEKVFMYKCTYTNVCQYTPVIEYLHLCLLNSVLIYIYIHVVYVLVQHECENQCSPSVCANLYTCLCNI